MSKTERALVAAILFTYIVLAFAIKGFSKNETRIIELESTVVLQKLQIELMNTQLDQVHAEVLAAKEQ